MQKMYDEPYKLGADTITCTLQHLNCTKLERKWFGGLAYALSRNKQSDSKFIVRINNPQR